MKRIKIKGKTVAGYSDVLTPNSVPRVVAPIFKMGNVVFFPPYELRSTYIVDPCVSDIEELYSFAANKQVTIIENPFPAKEGYTLWVNTKFEPQYGKNTVVEDFLKKFALKSIREAVKAAKERKWKKAMGLCNMALSADDRIPNSLCLRVAIRIVNKKTSFRSVEKSLIERRCSGPSFDAKVKAYVREITS